jgi:hypothetical protein
VRGARLRARSRLGRALLSSAVLWVALAASAALSAEGAEPLPPADPALDGPAYPVSQFVVQVGEDGEEGLPVAGILPLEVRLGVSASGLVAPREGFPVEVVRVPRSDRELRPFHASALGAVTARLLDAFRERGFMGVYVAPHEKDIDPRTRRDLRREGDSVLRIVVSTARVRELRSVGFGDRLPEDWRIDNPAHRRIRENSPIQPEESAREGTTDLLRRDLLEDYLFRLNRQPGRRVDAALSPSDDGRGVALDFRVTESRPWFVYGQSSDTGTSETARWQHRIGFVHRQLTNRDDILSLEFLNAGIDDVNVVSLGYEAPWFGSERPRWLRPQSEVPGWLDWIPREEIPWWGSDRLRWRLSGSWSRVLSQGLDFTDSYESVEWNVGGALVYNAWQHRALFLDVLGGLRVRDVSTQNVVENHAEALLVLPTLGAHLERIDDVSSLLADVSVEGNVRNLDPRTTELLGRLGPDDRWAALLFDAEFSHFLEPLLFRRAWEDPSTPGSSKLAHEAWLSLRGQYAFDYRLIPQASMVAGGLYSVRGYPQSTAVGDTVVIGSAEYRYYLARSLPIRRRPLRLPGLGDFRTAPQEVYGSADWDLLVRAFLDVGRTERNRSPAGSSEHDQTLLGAGVGLELRLLGNLRARADWGTALLSTKGSEDDVNAGDSEFHFLFTILY